VSAVIAKGSQFWDTQFQKQAAIIQKNSELLALDQSLSEKDIIRIQKELNHAKAWSLTFFAKKTACETWERYWTGTDAKLVPKKLSIASTQCPQVAFAMSSVKQILDLHLMQGIDLTSKSQSEISINGMNATDSAIYLAGAYNVGYVPFAQRCAQLNTLEACIQAHDFGPKNSNETFRHMKSIQSCSKKDSFEPMSGGEQKNCEGYRCSN
jgi:hypothetical protein